MIRPMTPPTASRPPQTSVLSKVRLLLWKNFLLQKRHKVHTIVDIFLPVCFFIFCAWLQKSIPSSTEPEHKYPSLPITTNDFLSASSINAFPPIKDTRLIFTPNNVIFKDFMKAVTANLQLAPAIGVDSSQELEKVFVDKGLLAGIEFHHSNVLSEMPKSLSYSLRFPGELRAIQFKSSSDRGQYSWHTDALFPPDPFPVRNVGYDDGGLPSYLHEGFLAIQNAIAKAFIERNKRSSSNDTMPEIHINRFPYPSYTSNPLISSMQVLVPLFFLLSLNYTFMNTVRFIATEKEKQLKEAMKIMGLDSWMHYLGWFIRTITMLTISMVLITVFLTLPWFGSTTAIFQHSNILCLMIFFLGYCICLITFGFVICAVFTQAKSAMTASTVLWYLTSAPFFLFSDKIYVLPGWLKLLFCLCPNTALSLGFKIIAQLEDTGVGLNWHTAFQTTTVYDNLTVATVFGFFILTAIILFFTTLYVENVFIGQYGVAKPWYFIFNRDFWKGLSNYQQFDNRRSSDAESFQFARPTMNKMNFEAEPSNKPVGIEIRHLTKKFMSDKAAVNHLSLNIYNNQITCLLGQNGAGKTTTISMLTGMIEPTSGTALINGYDIRTNMDLCRSSMGFCPQHNILFDELTVREHIQFYCCLKGLNNEAANAEVRKYTEMLELTDKMDTLSAALSGGMKRKLSVVIALCGHSKVVFLDEPTSGMDPGARRTLWDILLAEKKDRTILLTTHFMDEADVLSDRIAILADGELKCSGTSFFLKKRFGTGYHLVCAKNDGCDSDAVLEVLQKHIPEIRFEHENDTEISYLLPEEKNDLFKMIFEDLEINEDRLKLRGFGVSLTTLEEIFLKMGKADKIDSRNGSSHQSIDEENGISETRITLNDDHSLLHGSALWLNQAKAIFKKRYLCWLRSILSFCYYNFFVIIMLMFVIFDVGSLFTNSKGLPGLNIDFNKYRKPYAILPEILDSPIAKQYKSNVERSSANLVIVNDNMDESLLDLAQHSLRKFKFQYLTAATFPDDKTIIAWFNNQFYHTAALTLDLVHNAVLKAFSGDDYNIYVQNKPLKFQKQNDTLPDFIKNLDSFGYGFTIMIGIAMTVLSASYISFYIKEKERNAKFMQYASGANLIVFWGTSVLWDLFTNTITICIIIFMLILGQHDQWRSPSELSIIFLILFLYNFAMMPVICILSLIFSKPSTGMNVVSIFNMIIMFVFLLDSLNILHPAVHFLLWSFPLCTMIDATIKLPTIHTFERTCESTCEQYYNTTTCDWSNWCKLNAECCSQSVFSWNDTGIGKNLALMLGTGIVTFILLILLEVGGIKLIKSFIFGFIRRKNPYVEPQTVDSDVQAEKERIDKMSVSELQSETMVMQNVSKFYGNFCAVNQISLASKRGECFGLLGKNGAGKSSIFKMLTGETIITSGEVFTQGYNQKYHLPQIYQIIGYCPQFDALLSGLTCRETLEIFAMLRGIPARDVKYYIENCARSFDFIQHIDKKVKQLSGGNKRKLSASLAIIGNLSVIFLDEPTTGMDPATKRNLWNVVIQSREAGKSIVLTSHSMEECEALCTRMTVLVNGECKCLGSSQHLKNKFTNGFELKIKVKDDEMLNINIIEVKNFILQTFSGAIFREEYQGILTYTVPVENIKWSTVFGIMQNAKKSLKIEDYSISQTSLEQVVLTLVKDQKGRQSKEAE